jgi:hypothetical protein
VRAAAPVSVWGGGPLDCRRPEQRARWELTGGRLERRIFDPDGTDRGARPMLDQVVSFLWRPIAPGAVEVEIVRRRRTPGAVLRAGSARWHQVAETLEETRIVAASRSWMP